LARDRLARPIRPTAVLVASGSCLTSCSSSIKPTSLSTACGPYSRTASARRWPSHNSLRVKIAVCLSEQSAAGFVESQFCCVEQSLNDQDRRLHAEQRSRRQVQRPKISRNCRCVYPRISIFRMGTLERNPRSKQSRTERYVGINHSEPASSSSYRPLRDDNRNGALTLPAYNAK